jgi:hypothetical protein
MAISPKIKLHRWYLQDRKRNLLYRLDRFNCCSIFSKQQWSTEQQCMCVCVCVCERERERENMHHFQTGA